MVGKVIAEDKKEESEAVKKSKKKNDKRKKKHKEKKSTDNFTHWRITQKVIVKLAKEKLIGRVKMLVRLHDRFHHPVLRR